MDNFHYLHHWQGMGVLWLEKVPFRLASSRHLHRYVIKSSGSLLQLVEYRTDILRQTILYGWDTGDCTQFMHNGWLRVEPMKTLLSTAMLSTAISDSSIGQVIQKILRTGRITAAQQRWLLKANAIGPVLNDEEMQLVKQVCDRLSTGLVKVVD